MLAAKELLTIYHKLMRHFGPQHWWPAQSRLEIVVGAVLVQNTSWQNVDKALHNLRQARALNWLGINRLNTQELAQLIRPSGYHNIKAQRLENLLHLLSSYKPWHSFFKQDLASARQALLQVKGIGQETADALLLYVGQKPIFVVDAYTLRILSRHRWLPPTATYQLMQEFFMQRLPADTKMFAEFHALLVALAKNHCRKTNPDCLSCPLGTKLP